MKKNNKIFTKQHGDLLVKLARKTLMDKFNNNLPDKELIELETALKDPVFKQPRGTFVTLTIDGQLRGCIGTLTPSESALESVRRNAINAAFNDFRFNQLSPYELDKVNIEVSILTEPEPLIYKDKDDLISRLRVNIDGVIIKKGSASATFLPQVWKQLPNPEDFLSHLCSKAGLEPDIWKKDKLEVMTYQVQYFEE